MSNDFQTGFDSLRDQLIEIYHRWTTFRQVFTPDNIPLLESTAPVFFQTLQFVMVDDAIMGLCRITDDAKTGKHDNVSLEYMATSIDRIKYPQLKADLDIACHKVKVLAETPRAHRHKRIAHSDLSTSTQAALLPPLTLRDIDEALEAVREAVDRVELELFNNETAYRDQIVYGGAKELLYFLRVGKEKSGF